MERKYLWGVAPLDDFTNEAIAAELDKTSDTAGNTVIERDNHGNEIRLYIVPYNFIARLEKLRDSRFNFFVYVREGKSQWRIWNLFGQGKERKKKKMLEKVKRGGVI